MINTKTKTYYTLLIREDSTWSPAFGDYDLKSVDEEMDICSDDTRRKDMKIIATLDDQQSITTRINEINKEDK